jgi:hypothetical protein
VKNNKNNDSVNDVSQGKWVVMVEPFKDDGSLKEDLILYSSDLTDVGNLLFKEYYPKWSSYIDRGGDVNNTKILNDGLNILKNR